MSDDGSPAVTDAPSVEQFTEECSIFFADVPMKAEAKSFEWGVGSDRVGLFESPDGDDELNVVEHAREWRRKLFDAGLGWIRGPIEFGGRGLPASYDRILESMSRRHEVPSPAPFMISLGMVAPTVAAHATPGAKARYLSGLYRGDLIGCQLFSEPDAGSDLPSMKTSAERDRDGWRINGQKVWTSGAHFSDIGLLICRTQPEPRHRNLTAFVINMRQPGVEIRPLKQMTGGAAFNEVFFNDAWVPDDDRLGDVNDGWRVALTTLANERSAVGGPAFGGNGLFDVTRYRMMVENFGKSNDAKVRQDFARLYSYLTVAKLTSQRAAATIRAGGVPGPEAAIGKLALSNNFLRVSDFVTSVIGPALVADTGQWGTYAWGEFVLSAPGYRIGGGTDEILKNGLAERALGLPRDNPVRERPTSPDGV